MNLTIYVYRSNHILVVVTSLEFTRVGRLGSVVEERKNNSEMLNQKISHTGEATCKDLNFGKISCVLEVQNFKD